MEHSKTRKIRKLFEDDAQKKPSTPKERPFALLLNMFWDYSSHQKKEEVVPDLRLMKDTEKPNEKQST